ncbi:MAG: cysteine hydrolase family protein [Bryobacteraceae bacterium]
MKTVFFDVDTQIDFLFPAGALYFPGAEKILKTLGALTRFAAANRLPIVSTADAHSEDDLEFQTWKPHCVVGTAGQRKAGSTLLNQSLVLNTDINSLDAIRSRIANAAQIIVEKQMLDCFTNPNLRPLLDLIGANRYFVYGVATEHCVRPAAFGLLETGARVEVVTDAISGISASDEQDVLERFQSQGGVLTTSAAVTA